MALLQTDNRSIALIPLVGNQQTEEALWLGAMISKVLAEHLAAAGLPVHSYNTVARQLSESKIQLPLNDSGLQTIRRLLKAAAVISGRFVLDDEGKMLAFRLIVDAPEILAAPMEVSTPLAGFATFIERVALALVEQLGVEVDEAVRQKIKDCPRPASFEAFRQFSQGVMNWSKGQNQLALTSITSALTIDPDLEDAAAIEVAVARAAGDATTTREAFRRWTAIATKRRKPRIAAERLMMLGHWLLERGDWAEARRAYEDARNIYQTENDEFGKAQVNNNLANLEMLAGRLQNAIQSYRRTIRIFETDSDGRYDLGLTYYNLAIAHKNLGQPDEAEAAVEQAVEIARDLKNTALEAASLAQRGAIRDDLGHWSQAAADYQQALQLCALIDDQQTAAIIKTHEAVLKKQQGAYDQAEGLLLGALEAFEKGGDPHQQAVIWFNLGDLYFSTGGFDTALDYAQKAQATFEKLKSGWGSRARQLVQAIQSVPASSMPQTGPDEDINTPEDFSSGGNPSVGPLSSLLREMPGVHDDDIYMDNPDTDADSSS
jgi:tetratricopeptide (TPR) repeat protein